MLTPDEKAALKGSVMVSLSQSIRKAEGSAASEVAEMLKSIHVGRIDRAAGPSKLALISLEAADNLRVVDRWISVEVPGQYPCSRNRVTELFRTTQHPATLRVIRMLG